MRIIHLLTIGFTCYCANVLAMVDIQHWTTSNGAQVYFVPASELPIVDLSVVFNAGSVHDEDKGGIALLTNGLLNEGANGLSADAIAEQFDNLGAIFGNDLDKEMSELSLRSLSDPAQLEPALTLFANLLAKPDFPPQAFERVRQQILLGLNSEEQSPNDIAGKAFQKAIYGKHPYANPKMGTVESVKALTPEMVKTFYQRYYVAKNATISLVGAIDRPTAERIAETLVKQLPAGEPAPALPAVADLQKAETIHIPYPATQTHILVGQPSHSRHDPDYFSLYVGNHILGGNGLVSRVSQEVREKRGLAYTAYSYFTPMEERGAFNAGLQTRNDQAQQALAVLRDTLQTFIDKGVTEAELIAAKKNITGGFPLKIDSNINIVNYLAVIGFYHLPLDYLQKFNDRIEAVTVESINAAFKTHLQLDKQVTVTVGNTAM
ncbi:M16 family metallopeptidase [Beggiatoa leptomitoformis]|uniref:Insulinase family protein n=1 Tax=Beggiatoa leptomitoformis TaxID=288004 RepID=A0A2N9YFA4_9GAMM|nr:pitrilysin family protein [Beggiatoa leptomitoformis]ALG68606.1 insulinase family protein [Beggiatoa leptomitoformis]AUI69049.1 insulinase family protein [Beggiatoa leptomitoformis]